MSTHLLPSRGAAGAEGRLRHLGRTLGAAAPFDLEVTIIERVIDILLGILAGLLVGLVAVVLGLLVGSTPPDTPDRCVGLMVLPPAVGALCGGWAGSDCRSAGGDGRR